MAKLLPSLFVNAGTVRHLSTLSSSLNSIATHFEGFSRNPMSAKGIPKKHDRFDNVDDALAVFNKMIEKHPKPSIVEFTKLLAAIVRMKHYAVAKWNCLEFHMTFIL
ncbi:hypothetical protein HRI_004966900 [Hibiscus trionum]|uniref:Pentatricopeptide repeat-containing protein n=1 Tax=Hibiscus trionum TaxID=183268 RepID=A0A9W7JH30_HIBTR|nr:hypothetical protein HRI_004966900 [Hibiscus trionum]